MSVELYRESPGKFDSRTLSRTTLNRWTGRSFVVSLICCCLVVYRVCRCWYVVVYMCVSLCLRV